VATFSSTELFSFHSLVFYTVLLSVHSLGRAPLKKRVIDSPDVQSAIRESAALTSFLHSIYECQYKQFFEALGTRDLLGLRATVVLLAVCSCLSSMRSVLRSASAPVDPSQSVLDKSCCSLRARHPRQVLFTVPGCLFVVRACVLCVLANQLGMVANLV
jgi:hypothetical protein